MALVIAVLFGCAKEETTSQLEASGAFVFKTDGDSPVWEYVTLEEPAISPVAQRDNQGNSAHMHGDFPASPYFSGTQNNGGTHGSATLTVSGVTLTLETECVMVDGTEAVYGGIITEMDGSFPPFIPYGIGSYAYFKVFDNGEGNNAPADQYHGLIRFAHTSRCEIWTPGSGAWPATLFGFPMVNDIPEPGSVKVNN